MDAAIAFLLARLKEPSTWGSMGGGFASAAAGALTQGWVQVAGYLTTVGAVCGLVGMFMKDMGGTVVKAETATVITDSASIDAGSSSVTTGPKA